MYRCELCNSTVGEGVTARSVVLETRPTSYPPRQGANRRAKRRSRDDRGGAGWEIVREARVCAHCEASTGPVPIPLHSDDNHLMVAEAAE